MIFLIIMVHPQCVQREDPSIMFRLYMIILVILRFISGSPSLVLLQSTRILDPLSRHNLQLLKNVFGVTYGVSIPLIISHKFLYMMSPYTNHHVHIILNKTGL